jgi:hypothetical protein
LVNAGLSGAYFSSGNVQVSKDVQIACSLAEKLNLSHEIRDPTSQDTIEQWEVLCRRLIQQGDGMISLWQLPDVVHQLQRVDRLAVSLSGLGGEIARSTYYSPLDAVRRLTPADVVSLIADGLIFDYGGLVLPQTTRLSEAHLREFVAGYFDQGISGLDALDVFYAYQRVGRWAGSNRRKVCGAADAFVPLSTAPWVQATFTIPPNLRTCDWLHGQLIRVLAPELVRLPFDKGPERSQLPWLYLARWAAERSLNKAHRFTRGRLRRFGRTAGKNGAPAPSGQEAWLERKRDWFRQVCLDQRDSVLWDYVNRARFEKVMSDSTEPAERWAYRLGIYGITTLFYYTAIDTPPAVAPQHGS